MGKKAQNFFENWFCKNSLYDKSREKTTKSIKKGRAAFKLIFFGNYHHEVVKINNFVHMKQFFLVLYYFLKKHKNN